MMLSLQIIPTSTITMRRRSPSLPDAVVAALAIAFALAPALAQSPSRNGPNRLTELKHFEEIVLAKRGEASVLPDTDAGKRARIQLLGGPLEQLGLARTFVGDVQGGLDALDERASRLFARRESKPEDRTRVAAVVAEDAIAAIVREARQRRIVIINESHHVPMHRAFTMALARELRKVG